jgi:hypothetical protein
MLQDIRSERRDECIRKREGVIPDIVLACLCGRCTMKDLTSIRVSPLADHASYSRGIP